MLITGGQTLSQVVTLVTIKVKDLNNDSLYSIYYQFMLVTSGHIGQSLSMSVTSTVMTLMFVMPLWTQIRNL